MQIAFQEIPKVILENPSSGIFLNDFSNGNNSETLVIFPLLTLKELLVIFLRKLSRKITGEIIREYTDEVSERIE